MPFNPAFNPENYIFSNGNRTVEYTGDGYTSCILDTLLTDGRLYYEIVFGQITGSPRALTGYQDATPLWNKYPGQELTSFGYRDYGDKLTNNQVLPYGDEYYSGDVVGHAIDMVLRRIWWHRNGVWQGGGNPETGEGAAYSDFIGDMTPALALYVAGDYATVNETSEQFVYDPPIGFSGLGDSVLVNASIGLFGEIVAEPLEANVIHQAGSLGFHGGIEVKSDKVMSIGASLSFFGETMAELLEAEVIHQAGSLGFFGALEIEADNEVSIGASLGFFGGCGIVKSLSVNARLSLGFHGGTTLAVDDDVAVRAEASIGFYGSSKIEPDKIVATNSTLGFYGTSTILTDISEECRLPKFNQDRWY